MAMRTECRHYESRTYNNGEIVRKCRVDAAPEAPWRCPEDCVLFELRMIDVGWQVGPRARPEQAVAPEPEGQDIGALLNEAEDIINSAAPGIIAEVVAESSPKKKKKKKRKRR